MRNIEIVPFYLLVLLWRGYRRVGEEEAEMRPKNHRRRGGGRQKAECISEIRYDEFSEATTGGEERE